MKGIVTKVDTDAKLKTWAVTALTIKTDQGEKTYNFFKKSEAIDRVNRLQVGQHVDVKLKKEGNYWNPVDVDVLSVDNTKPPDPAPRSNYWNPEKDREIRRAVCLKAAVDLAPQAKTLDVVDVSGIIRLATMFESYLEKGVDLVNETANLLDS